MRSLSSVLRTFLPFAALSCLLSCESLAYRGHADDRLASLQRIGVVLDADGEQPLARLCFGALMLDLTVRGYAPMDLRPIAGGDLDSLERLLRRNGSVAEALAVLRVSTDSVEFRYAGKRADGYWRTHVPRVRLSLTITGVQDWGEVFAAKSTTEAKIFSEDGQNEGYYAEPEGSLVQRCIRALLEEIPSCGVTRRVEVRYRLPVVAYADQAFRLQHGEPWQKVLAARLDVAAGFFRTQFQLDLQLAGIRPWEYGTFSTVEQALTSLERKVGNVGDTLVLGFVFDPKSVRISGAEAHAGMASFLSNVCVIREMPALLDEEYWYLVKHSLVIVHEIAHMLGAVHVADEESFLYPEADHCGFRFDSLNVTVLNTTRRSFGRLDFRDRVRGFLPLVMASQVWPRFRGLLMVESLQEVLAEQWWDSAGTRIRLVALDTTRLDSALMEALAGYRAFSRSQWRVARGHFQAAVRQDPSYAEGYSYLARIAEAEGDSDAAVEYRRLWRARGAAGVPHH